MYYEVKSKRIIVDNNGCDKEVAENFIVDGCEFFAEAEQRTMMEYNNENTVIAIKQSKILEFVNAKEDDEQEIYLATIVSIFIDEENGAEKETKYIVGVWASSVDDATKKTHTYMNSGLQDMILVAIKRTKFVDVLC